MPAFLCLVGLLLKSRFVDFFLYGLLLYHILLVVDVRKFDMGGRELSGRYSIFTIYIGCCDFTEYKPAN